MNAPGVNGLISSKASFKKESFRSIPERFLLDHINLKLILSSFNPFTGV